MCNILHTYSVLKRKYEKCRVRLRIGRIQTIEHLRLKTEMIVLIKEFQDSCVHDVNVQINDDNTVYNCKKCFFIREVSLRV